MHFYESSIITTTDGLHCQVYGNEHPLSGILVKPKYIPTEKLHSDALPYRFISGRKMNRLDLWSDKKELARYISRFRKIYPEYIYKSSMHTESPLFFSIPINRIERVYSPKRGLSELMSMPLSSLDSHLRSVHDFVNFLLESGLKIEDLGVTYSTLMGHYLSSISDINIVVYGKKNFWKLMKFLENGRHDKLRWKTDGEWMRFYARRDRFSAFSKELFLRCMKRKHSEGFVDNTLFVIFGVELEEETWFRWDRERYLPMGQATVEGTVADDHDSVVRPGRFLLEKGSIIKGDKDVEVSQVVFYSRDYCMLARKGERIQATGQLEEVTSPDGKKSYRIVIGYFDAYLSPRREKEIITVLEDR